MQLFLDTANVEEIKEINAWGVLSGITTNPSLIVKEGRDFKTVVKEICNIVDGPVSAEVTAEDVDGMVKQGLDIATWAENVVVKCPLTANGLAATSQLSKKGIKVNVTLCFSANQALLAARAGAYFISPFVGRLDDINQDGSALVAEIVEMYHMQGLDTKVLAASIRTPVHVTQAALAGADVATMPYKVFRMLVKHPLTDTGLALFAADWAKANEAVAAKK